MHENFLHYLWRTRRFDLSQMATTEGESLEILDFGEYNTHSGPDFLNARVRINDILWAGNVEMHLKSSDWLLHGHQHDEAYNNVVLHVVYENDAPIFYKKEGRSECVKCMEMKHRIPEGIYKKYWALLNNEHWIPCQHHLYQVSDLVKNACFERMLIERLERKTTEIAIALERNRNDWEETFYQFTARYFGVKENSEPMEWLARSLPNIILSKHKNQLFQIEALLFGQAGLLETAFEDAYPNALKKEYQFLKHKHHLSSINTVAWKFARLRPANFPTIRLAQLAQLIHQSSHLFSKIIDIEEMSDIQKLFEVKVSDYWQTHYVFDTPSVSLSKTLGKDTVRLMVINTVIPFLFYYGTYRKEDKFIERAFDFLRKVHPEKNTITEGWQKLGTPLESAHRTQALIHLKTEYCDKKRCLDCAIGNSVLNSQ
jgi:Protein of unknown function (DUF2851)